METDREVHDMGTEVRDIEADEEGLITSLPDFPDSCSAGGQDATHVNHSLLRQKGSRKCKKKYKIQVHNKNVQETENYDIDSREKLEQYIQKNRNQ